MNRSAALLLAVVILIWGANWPVLKVALAYISPLWLAAFRLGIAAVCLFVILAATKGRVRLPSRQDMPLVLSISLLQMALFTALINFGLLYVDAGRSAILSYTTPLWVTPAAALFLGERLTVAKVAGVALGMAGVAVMFNPFSFDWNDRDVLLGNGLLLLAALAWAVAILHTRGHNWLAGPLDLAPWQMLIGFLPVLAAAFIVDGPPKIVWSAELVAALVYNGPIATAFAFWAVVTVTRMLPAITTSLSFLGVPVVGLLFSAAFLDEGLTADNLTGLGLIVAGVAVVTFTTRPES